MFTWFPFRWIPYITALILFSVSLNEYTQTVAPTIDFEDTTEFIATAHTLSIPHPTGYPLYNLLGKLFSLIPIQSPSLNLGEDLHSIAFRLNFFNCFLASSTLVLLFFIFFDLFEKLWKKPLEEDPFYNRLALSLVAYTALLGIAFGKTFWRQTTFAEVYHLHIFLLALQIFLLQRWSLSLSKQDPLGNLSILRLFSLIFGLSFGNHMTMGTFLPAHLLFILVSSPRLFLHFRELLFLSFNFFFGISIYLYLPLRTFMGCEFHWFPIDTFEKFWWTVTAQSYGATDLLAKFGNQGFLQFFTPHFERFFGPILFSELSFPFICLGIIGFFYSFWVRPLMGCYLTLLFFPNLMYFMLQQFHPDFLLPQWMIWGLWCCFALMGFSQFIHWLVPGWGFMVPFFFLILIFQERHLPHSILKNFPVAKTFIQQAQGNKKEVDRSDFYSAYHYSASILNQIEPGGVAIFSQDAMAPLMYFQHVNKRRPDITFIHEFLYPFQKFGLHTPNSPHPDLNSKLNLIEKEFFHPYYSAGPYYIVKGDPGRGQIFDYLENHFRLNYDLFHAGFLWRLKPKMLEEEKSEFVYSNYEKEVGLPETPLMVRWGNLFIQTGYTIEKRTLKPGDNLNLSLFFEGQLPITPNFQMNMLLTEQDEWGEEKIVLNIIREPTDGCWPTSKWKFRHQIKDTWNYPLFSHQFGKKSRTFQLKIAFFNPIPNKSFTHIRLKQMPGDGNFPMETEGLMSFLDYHVLNFGEIKYEYLANTLSDYPKIKEFTP